MPYPLSNILIDGLPADAHRKLLSQMKRMPIPVYTSLYEPGDVPKYVHFLTSGIASIVTAMSTGDTTEVGTVGREGLPQGTHLLGELPVPTRCFMQIGGTGFRMEYKAFQQIFEGDSQVRRRFSLLAVSIPPAQPNWRLQSTS